MSSATGDEALAITFGPVPSRRLGRSLGINNVPPKTCSYACVYCQLGRTTTMRTERRAFYPPEAIEHVVRARVDEVRHAGETIDYLTFVPDGEPTLDAGLGETIERLKPLGIPIAVITNGSCLSRPDVQRALSSADWVSVKIDAADEATWRTVDRPHKALAFDEVRDGSLAFADRFGGRLVTETMLVRGVNDGEDSVERIADLVRRLNPAIAYLAAPIRPPAEAWVEVPDEASIVAAYATFADRVDRVELLIEYEGDAFSLAGGIEETLLATASVHPLREDAVDDLLTRSGSTWDDVDRLVADGRLVRRDHRGHAFFVRRQPGR